MKKLMILVALLMLVASAQAWTIEGGDYTGTIEFHENGVGVAHIDGYPPAMFSWKWISGNQYEARYFWYRTNFTYENGIITSSMFPGARLV